MRKKIGIIGAGNVGGEIARLAAIRGLGDITLLDLPSRADYARGKALDIEQAAAIDGGDARVAGTSRWEDVAGADVLVITVGLPRKPGQSREDLVYSNLPIIREVAASAKAHCPDAFSIVISNPLDAMVYEYRRVSGFSPRMVAGMAGVLDTARFAFFVARELGVSPGDIHGTCLGSHGDSIVPLVSSTTASGVPIRDLLPAETIRRLIERTRGNGTELVSLMGTSAYYAAAASTLKMMEAYLLDQKRVLPCAALLNGQYGQSDIYMGVPAVIGGSGVEKVIVVGLSGDEKRMLEESASRIRETLGIAQAMIVE